MSESEFFEAPSDSFWEINQYRRVVKRTEDGYKLSNDLMQMLSERASIEKLYSKSLRQWAKKWSDYLEKSCEYGSMKATWQSMTAEANNISDVHIKVHDEIEETLLTDVKAWQKQNYPKAMVSGLKIVKLYDEEFTKAQKPWAKKYTQVEKSKKEYHNQCKLLQSAKVAEANSKTDASLSAEQKKKIEDKVEKHRKEVENAKHKYQLALDDLNQYNARYIEDMKAVYKKCDTFEKQRLDYFIEKFHQVHGFVDLTKKTQLNTIYSEFMSTIKSTNPDKDLLYWSKLHGAAMAMNWPTFEEYSEEFKNIAKGEKKSKLNEDNGITMTSIKQKEDHLPESSVLRRKLSILRKRKKVKKRYTASNIDDVGIHSDDNNLIKNETPVINRLPISTSQSYRVHSTQPSTTSPTVVVNKFTSRSSSNLESTTKPSKAMAPTPRRFDTIEYPPEQNPFADQDDSMSDGDSNKASNSNNNNNKKANLNSSNASSTSVDSAAAKAVKDKNERYENETQAVAANKNDAANPFGDDSDDDSVPAHNYDNNNAIRSKNNNNNNHDSNSALNRNNNNHANESQYLSIKVRAIYDYQSTEDDELSFKAGDEFIKLLNEDDRGWCLGRIGSKVGLYPATYAVDQ